MQNPEQIQCNWQSWLVIESAIKSHVLRFWHDPTRAEDVLSGAMEVFVRRNRGDYPRPRQIAFAKLCCRHAARGLAGSGGYWTTYEQVGGETRQREFVSLQELQHLKQPTGDAAAALDRKYQAESRLEALERLLSGGLVNRQFRDAIRLMVAGGKQAHAATAVGLTPLQLHRGLRELCRALSGRPASRRSRARERRDRFQLSLFSLDLA